MKHFIITKAAGLNILWLWDSKLEKFEKLDEGITVTVDQSLTEAKAGDSEKNFCFFWIENDELHQTPKHCSDVKNYDNCLIYQKNELWYLRKNKLSDEDECLGRADSYYALGVWKDFYLKDFPGENYTMFFLTPEPFNLVQKQYGKQYFVCDEKIVVERSDGYFDIYRYGSPAKAELITVDDCNNKMKIYGFVPKVGAYQFLAQENSIIAFHNAYLLLDENGNGRLYAVSEGYADLVDEGKFKMRGSYLFQINDKLYPVCRLTVQWEEAKLTFRGKIKHLFEKSS